TRLEALELNVLGDGEPKLEQQDVAFGQLLFELIDFFVGTLPFKRFGEFLDALDQDTAIPGAVKDGDMSACRQSTPETPQIGPRPLFVGGSGNGHGTILPRIQGMGDAPYSAAF